MIYFDWLSILMSVIPLVSANLEKTCKFYSKKAINNFTDESFFVFCLMMGFYHVTGFSILGILILTHVEAFYLPLTQSVMTQMVYSHLKVAILSIYSIIMNMVGIFINVSFGIAGNQKIQWVMLLEAFFCLVSLICQ